MEALSGSLGIPRDLLAVTVTKGPNAQRGTFVHPHIGYNLGQWLSPAFAVQVSQWIDDIRSKGYATAPGVEVGALAEVYARASLAAKTLGASQDQLLTFVNGVSAAVRIQGASSAQASGALLQLSQGLGSGIFRSEEFNSVLEGLPVIAQAVANNLDKAGGSVAKLRTLIAAGQVTSQEFFQAFLKGSGTLEAQAGKATL